MRLPQKPEARLTEHDAIPEATGAVAFGMTQRVFDGPCSEVKSA
jgi:hypothetical protein